MNVRAALTNDETLRHILIGTGVMAIIVGAGLWGTAIYQNARMRSEIAIHTDRIDQLEKAVAADRKLDTDRLDLIESFVFGQVASDLLSLKATQKGGTGTTHPAQFDAWIVRRDNETRERVRRLELWRFNGQ